MKLFKWFLFYLAAVALLSSCTSKKNELIWDKDLYIIGSQSSPRTSDLNGDGILDIVMGAGQNEFQFSKMGVIALNGQTGDLLWQQEATNQMFGSATFCDITNDSIEDVFITGRGNQLMALNGKTGAVIWKYKYQYESDPILKYARFNFYNSVLIPDQNHDGLNDLLIVCGGNEKAVPYSEENRFPGVLMVFDIKTGEIIAADTMPDGKESYMSPLCFSQVENKDYTIVFGTGGETISGSLYIAFLSDLMNKRLTNAIKIAEENGHGFIAPPVLADITGDNYYDIVAISHGSTMFAINGSDHSLIWKQHVDSTESSNSFAVGYFTEDKVPDFFTFVSRGQWPQSTGSVQIMIDGKNGNIVFMDSIGCTGFSSPVVYDLNHDGRDEVILSINEYDCGGGFTGKSPADIENKLIALDLTHGSVYTIDHLKKFKNVFSTPWIGDIDHDRYLDIIYCQYFNPSTDLLSFLGMKVKRFSTNIKVKKVPDWGAYMGSEGNGIFPRETVPKN